MENTPLATVLSKLIACKSVTPHEGGTLNYIETLLIPLGFEIERMDKENVANLYAYRKGEGKHIAFAGHVDVVPTQNLDLWHADPFTLFEQHDQLFARGLVDMKGAIACFLDALHAFLKNTSKTPPSISIVLTSDEEGEAVHGSRHMVEMLKKRGVSFDMCLIGEPTSVHTIGDTLKIGRRGSFHGILSIQGREGHIAYPDTFQNPITLLIKALHALKQRPLDQGNGPFLPSNMEITHVEGGGIASNVIPREAKARFNIRFNDLWTPIALEHEVHKRLEKGLSAEEYPCVSLKTHTSALSFHSSLSPLHDVFTQSVQAILPALCPEYGTSGGTSDARFLKDLGPVIECGLKHSSAHSINETTTWTDLYTLRDIYMDFLKRVA
jgi:succinyl-diaminopimelate desuccinylase